MRKALITGLSGRTLSPQEAAFLRAARPCGLILFARNCAARDEIRALVDAAVEAQALDLLPVQLTLVTGRFQRRTRSVFVGGALLENRRALPGGSIQLLAGPTAARLGRLAVTRTNANGNYGGRLKLKAGTWYLRARATVRSRTRNGCAVETVAAVPCLRTTTSGFTHTSAVVRLVVPR